MHNSNGQQRVARITKQHIVSTANNNFGTLSSKERFELFRSHVEQTIEHTIPATIPHSLYEPMKYIIAGGGKRVRPVLAMLAAESAGGNPFDATMAGISVELIHNFTLIHDDIMDAAQVRRGRPTVHITWGIAPAILSGDALIPIALRILTSGESGHRLAGLVGAFTTGIVEVCEGQAFDLEFEGRRDITPDEYLMMIDKKTAKMLEFAVSVGATTAGASPTHHTALRNFARAVGIAFQIQDDLLDLTADSPEFGKTIGGDIIEGKRTYMVVQALHANLPQDDRSLLDEFFTLGGFPAERVSEMRDMFERNGIIDDARNAVALWTSRAEEALSELPQNGGTEGLRWLAGQLLQRQS